MDGDILAKRKQTHPVSCRDGEGLVVTFDALELAALLDGLLRGGIDMTGGLGKVEGGFTHKESLSFSFDNPSFLHILISYLVTGQPVPIQQH